MASSIPTELLVTIFEWYATLYCTFRTEAPTGTAWPLGLVCSHWRALALSMPYLWNQPPMIRIPLGGLHRKDFTDNWKLYLDRSANLPLSLHFFFDTPPNDILNAPYWALSHFLTGSRRWEHVTISGLTVGQTQIQFQHIRWRLDILRSVTFNFAETTFNVRENNIFNVFDIAPRLTTILLHSPSRRRRKSRLNFPWKQLTTYKETGVDMGTFPIVLDLSPHLECLYYRGRNFSYLFTNPIHHDNLRHMLVDAVSLHIFWEQLGKVTAPSLEALSIAIPQHQPESFSTPAITDFIIRSGCSLKKLVVDTGSAAIRQDLKDLLFLTPELETLELGSCHTPFLQDSVLQMLVLGEDHNTLLPQLRSLTLTYREDPEYDDIALISLIASSRKLTSEDYSAPLEHVRIVSSDVRTRFRVLCHLGGWEDPLLPTYDSHSQPLPGSFVRNLDPAHHYTSLFKRVKQRCLGTTFLPPHIPELLSLFTLAYLIPDQQSRQILFELLENIHVLSSIKSHLLHSHWIPGGGTDILYVHPSRDPGNLSEIWTHIANKDVKALDDILGYKAHSEREDDLRDGAS